MKTLTREEKFLLATGDVNALLNAGASLSALRNAGASWSALRNAGVSWRDLLKAGVSLSDLRNAGVSWRDLLNAGASWSDLLNAGVSWRDLRNAGVSLSALLNAGASWSDLLNAGVSLSALRNAGASWSALLDAGASWRDLRNAGASLSEADVPVLDKPYTRLLSDITEKKRLHKQSTFGPEDFDEKLNLCKTPMCTAGHLVNMAGEKGWKLKKQFGFLVAASLIHQKAHPDWPCQDFGPIPQDWAMAYIETMAEREAKEQE